VHETSDRPLRAVSCLCVANAGLIGCRRRPSRVAWAEVAGRGANVDALTAPNQNALSDAKSAGMVTTMILTSSAIDQLCA